MRRFLRLVTESHRMARLSAGLLLAAGLAGCAANMPQGYGVAAQSTAAQAQQQLQAAEQATTVDTVQTYLDLIAQMQENGQWYASLAHAEAFEQQHGARPQSRLLRADALRNTGQLEAARAIYLTLLEGGTAARARRGLGLLYAAEGHYGAAIEQLQLARALNPIDATVLADIGYAHLLDGQPQAARVPLLQAAQLAPNDARVQLNLALYWLATGQNAQANALLRRLSTPQTQGAKPLIDQASILTLQQQHAQVMQAVAQRAAQQSTPPVSSVPTLPIAPAASLPAAGSATPVLPPPVAPAPAAAAAQPLAPAAPTPPAALLPAAAPAVPQAGPPRLPPLPPPLPPVPTGPALSDDLGEQP